MHSAYVREEYHRYVQLWSGQHITAMLFHCACPTFMIRQENRTVPSKSHYSQWGPPVQASSTSWQFQLIVIKSIQLLVWEVCVCHLLLVGRFIGDSSNPRQTCGDAYKSKSMTFHDNKYCRFFYVWQFYDCLKSSDGIVDFFISENPFWSVWMF